MIRDVPLKDIKDNPFQPRITFEPGSIQSLADEIKAEGFWGGTLQGRRNGRGQVELVFGHRRLRALRLLKVPSIKIELVELTDAQMALRSLEENLQREGLTDLEKADAVKKAVEIERAARLERGESERGAVQSVAERLGFTPQWVNQLCNISETMVSDERTTIERGHLTAKTALAAKDWGGSEYVKTLAGQGKAAKQDETIASKPTHMTVAAMKQVVAQAPEPVRERLKEEIVTGKVQTPEEAAARARRLASSHVRREKLPPQDLKIVIVGMSHELQAWTRKLKEIEPYMDYVDEVPAIANRFRDVLGELVETAKMILKAAR